MRVVLIIMALFLIGCQGIKKENSKSKNEFSSKLMDKDTFPIPPPPPLPPPEPEVGTIFKVKEHFPIFPTCEGGDGLDKHNDNCCKDEFAHYIKSNLKYPEEARRLKLEETIVIRLAVYKKDSISNGEVVRGQRQDFKDEALRIIKSMPHYVHDIWISGKSRGKPKVVYYNIPIVFKLEEKE